MKRFRQVIMYLFLAILPMAVTCRPVSAASLKTCSRRPTKGWARCHAQIVVDAHHKPLVSLAPQGYGPADFHLAYGGYSNSHTPIAVVTAYDAPNIASDLAVFSRVYGLPIPGTCNTSGQAACVRKIDQRGGTNFPSSDAGWAVEASLDIETVHGMCPSCPLTLVEAKSANMNDLAQAVDEALNLGSQVVSNSYGGPELPNQTDFDTHFYRKGVAIIASSGDSGYGAGYPAASKNVIAVGGTDLHISSGRVTSETAWIGSGSGCSKFEPKPVWQHDIACKRRSISDVSADADPATGAAIYDSYPESGRKGWFKVGGTSLAAPLVAGMLGGSGVLSNQPAWLYSNPSVIRDIKSGHNGSCKNYLCQAGTGYDGPTGLGVLNL